MPVLAELGASAEVGDGVDAAVLHPQIHGAAETRGFGNVEPTVAREEHGVLAVLLDSLLADDKHWNAGTIFRLIPDLLHFERGSIDGGSVNFVPQRLGPATQIVAVNRGWHGVGLKSEKEFRTVPFAADGTDAADGGQRNFTKLLAFDV